MDKILIRQLQVDAFIGIHDWEKQNKQTLYFDMDLSFDCKTAGRTDNIDDALDYFEVCEQVTTLVSNSQFELIERLAEAVCHLILDQFNCEKIKLTLFKPDAIGNTQSVGVRISRSQNT